LCSQNEPSFQTRAVIYVMLHCVWLTIRSRSFTIPTVRCNTVHRKQVVISSFRDRSSNSSLVIQLMLRRTMAYNCHYRITVWDPILIYFTPADSSHPLSSPKVIYSHEVSQHFYEFNISHPCYMYSSSHSPW